MKSHIAWLKSRRDRNRNPVPDFRWKAFLLAMASLVPLAMLVLDSPMAAGNAQVYPIARAIGDRITDFGKADWMLAASAMLFLQALAASRILTTARARAHAWFVSQASFYLFTTIALSGLSVNLLKRLIGRARPIFYDEYGIFHFVSFAGNSRFESFPSGHATTVGAFFMALALLLPRHRLLFLILAIWFAMSRVIVNAHYPSDIIAGATYGAWFSLVTALIFSRYRLVFRISSDGTPIPRQPLILPLRKSETV